jgi:hypothetical protein
MARDEPRVPMDESRALMQEPQPVERPEHAPTERIVAVEQSIAREEIREQTITTELAPVVVIPEQRPSPEPAVTPQQTPGWKMEPVTLPPELVMIETQHTPSSFNEEPEMPRRARTPRPRKESLEGSDEPLQQVETGQRQSAGNDAA